MMTDPAHPAVLAPKLASWAAVLAVVTGAMVLAGWAFDITVLKSIWPGWVSMKANAAVGFILTGVALWLTARSPATFNPKLSIILTSLGRLCGLLAGLIGLLSLGEYVFDWNPDIDHWLFREPANAVGTSHSGRMAPEAALCFVLLAVALWLAGGSRKTRWTILASASLGLLVTALALAAMLSYLTPGLGSYGWFGLTIMAMHAGILFSVLGTAVIAISWRQDILPWSLSNSTTAAFACGTLLLVLIGFNTNRSQFRLAEVNRMIAFSEEIRVGANSVDNEIVDAQAHAHYYLITGEERFRNRYLEAMGNGIAKLDELRKLVADDLQQQQQFARIEAQVKAQLEWFQQIIDAGRTKMTVAARNNLISHGEDLLDRLRITFDQVENEHYQLIQELKQELESVSRLCYLIISIGTLASLLIFMTEIFRLNFAVNERRRAEEALRKSTDLLLSVVENVPGRIFWKDRDLRYLGCNTLFAKDAGCSSPDELTGKTDFELVWKDQAELYRADDMAVMESGIPRLDYDEPQTTPDGSTIWLRTSKVPLRNEHNQNIGILGIYQDITERKRSEDLLRKLSLAVEQSPSSIVITDLDANIEYVNEGFVNIAGYSRAEAIGQNPRIMQSGKTPKENYQDMWAHLERGEVWKGELINRRKDGSEYIESVLMSPVRNANGSVTHYLAIKEDITQFKLAQEALRASRENLHRLLNSMAEGAYGVDLNGDCTFINRSALQMLGYQNENELLGKHIHELIHHSHADGSPYAESECNVYRAYRNNQSSHVSDEMFWRKDGIAIPVEFWAQPIVSDGMVTGAIVTFTDITERKRAEGALRVSEERFRTMFARAPLGIALIDSLTGHIYEANPRFAEIAGRSMEEMANIDWLKITHPDDVQADLKKMALLNAGKINRFQMEKRYLHPDGTAVWISMTVAPLQTDDKAHPRHLCMIQDITERKQAEASLVEQLEELRRWHDVTSGREGRILDLKHEVNELLSQAGQPPRYPSAESQEQIEE